MDLPIPVLPFMTPATVVVSHATLCQLFHIQEACPGDIMNGDAYFSVFHRGLYFCFVWEYTVLASEKNLYLVGAVS